MKFLPLFDLRLQHASPGGPGQRAVRAKRRVDRTGRPRSPGRSAVVEIAAASLPGDPFVGGGKASHGIPIGPRRALLSSARQPEGDLPGA